MKASARIGLLAFVAAIAAVPGAARALNAADPASPVAIGPQPLESFSLKGTVTRRAEPVTTAPARPEAQQAQPTARRAEPQAQAPTTAQQAPQASSPRISSAPQPQVAEPTRTASYELPPIGNGSGPLAASPSVAAPAFAPPPSPVPDPLPATQAAGAALGDGPPVSWLFLALLFAIGAGYYFFRQRSRTAYAGAGFDLGAQPEPAPAPPEPKARPVPEPLKRDVVTAGNGGIVSTRLRPWLDIDFVPIRFVLTDDRAILEFEMSVQNSGAGPARDVQVEAALFTASPSQDQEIGAFFAHPEGAGSPVEAILPLKRMGFTNQVVLTRDQLKLFQVDGKLMFVPLIGFTALYRWSGGNGQTSASYIVGRTTGGEKLGPLRADLGPRVFRKLEARAHSLSVRK